jgi:hypothetical protein
MGNNNEVFDAKLYTIMEALRNTIENHIWTHISNKKTIRTFPDSTSALKRMQDNGMGPGQWIIKGIAKLKRVLYQTGPK